jgi:hypothetical protein
MEYTAIRCGCSVFWHTICEIIWGNANLSILGTYKEEREMKAKGLLFLVLSAVVLISMPAGADQTWDSADWVNWGPAQGFFGSGAINFAEMRQDGLGNPDPYFYTNLFYDAAGGEFKVFTPNNDAVYAPDGNFTGFDFAFDAKSFEIGPNGEGQFATIGAAQDGVIFECTTQYEITDIIYIPFMGLDLKAVDLISPVTGGSPDFSAAGSLITFGLITNLNASPAAGGAMIAAGFDNYSITVKEGGPIPEPGTITLLAAGTLGLLGYGWRRRKRA